MCVCVCVYIHVFMDGIYRYIRKEQMFIMLFYFLDFISSFLLEKEIDILGTMTKYRTSMEVFGMLVFSVTPNKGFKLLKSLKIYRLYFIESTWVGRFSETFFSSDLLKQRIPSYHLS